MNEDAQEFQNKWNKEYLDSGGLLNKSAVIEIEWGKNIRFDFLWENKTTTITVNNATKKSSIVGVINFSMVGRIDNSLDRLISSASDNTLELDTDGKLYVKAPPEPEFPPAVLAATNW